MPRRHQRVDHRDPGRVHPLGSVAMFKVTAGSVGEFSTSLPAVVRQPARHARPASPARPARPARPACPARPARPACPARPARPASHCRHSCDHHRPRPAAASRRRPDLKRHRWDTDVVRAASMGHRCRFRRGASIVPGRASGDGGADEGDGAADARSGRRVPAQTPPRFGVAAPAPRSRDTRAERSGRAL
jgi:hypothetical protein